MRSSYTGEFDFNKYLEKVVDAEVAGVVRHVVHAGVGEVGQHVRPVEAGHGDFGNQHLLEGGEGGEDALAARLAAESGGHRKVVALHAGTFGR